MTITCELVIVRHGEAVCNVDGIVGGEVGCTGLTERGRQQAHQLAVRLAAEHAHQPFDSFHTTPRLRVRQTADVIATRLGLTPAICDELRGPDHGRSDGQPWHRVRTSFGGNPRRYPDRAYAPGSETWNDYLSRVGSAIRAVIDRSAGGRILIAGHRETIEAAHTVLLGLRRGSSTHIGFVTDHACLARWQHHVDQYGQAMWKLAAHNDGRHLAVAAR